MAKKVLFQPEDFDKPQKKSSKKKLGWAFGICAALALAGIGGYALLAPKTLETTDEVVAATSSVKEMSDNGSAHSEDTPFVEVSDEATVNSSEMDDSEKKAEEGQFETGGNQKAVSVAEQNPTGNYSTAAQIAGESLDREAMKVIRGDYGDGRIRMNQLGSRYQTIQKRVNQLKREGAF